MNRQTLANVNLRLSKGKMKQNQTLNRSCPTSINVAANSTIVTNDDHIDSSKTNKQKYVPISKIISGRCSSLRRSKIGIGDGPVKDVRPQHLPKSACAATVKYEQRPRDIFDGRGHVPPSHNDCAPSNKSHKWSTPGPKLRSLSLPPQKPGAVVIPRAEPISNAFPPPNKYPSSSDLPSMMTPNVSRENAFQPTANHYHQSQGLQYAQNQYQNCSALDVEVRTYVKDAFTAWSSNLSYAIGQMLRHHRHALPFSSSSQAHAMLTKLPIDSPLFVNWGGEWTYGRLSGRFEDTGGEMCVIVVLNGRGDVKKIFKKRNWGNRIMLVNWNALGTPASSNKPAKSVRFQCDTEVHSLPRPPPPSHSAFPTCNNGAREILNVVRLPGNQGLASGAAGTRHH